MVAALVAICSEASAQWSLGLRGGWNSTTISRYNGGRMDESYSALHGFDFSIQGIYSFNTWLAVRADLGFMQRSHRMDRNLNYLNPVYTEHVNNYLTLPLYADFSFGSEKLRGHLLTGAYAGYWINEHRSGITYWMTDYNVYFEPFDEKRDFTDEDQRLVAGFSFGAEITYSISSKLELGIDALYFYDLTSHHKGNINLADPRYLNTLSIGLNVNYKL